MGALVLLGFVLGPLIATRVMYTSGMGFDRLSDALGGAMLGVVIALVVGIVSLRWLTTSHRLWIAVAALVGAVLCMLTLRATSPRVAPPREIPAAERRPHFSLQIETDRRMLGSTGSDGPGSGGNRALGMRFLRISSNGSFDYRAWEDPAQHCLSGPALGTEAGQEALRRLHEALVELPADLGCPPPCPTCVNMGFAYWLEQERYNPPVSTECWLEGEALRPLRGEVEGILQRFSGAVQCESS